MSGQIARVLVILRAKLKQAGFDVLEVDYYPSRKRDEWPALHAVAQAVYARPSHRVVIDQGVAMWQAMLDAMDFTVPDAVDTLLVTGQLWSHFILVLEVPITIYGVFRPAYNAAVTPEAKDAALGALMAKAHFEVFDLNAGDYVNEKDFTNKHFARERRGRL